MIRKFVYFLIILYIRLVKKSKIAYSVVINKNTVFEGFNSIHRGVVLSNSHVGYATFVGSNCTLPQSRLGKYCSIAENVKVIVYTHPSSIFVSTHPAFYSILKQSGFTYVKNQKFEEVKYFGEEKKYSVDVGNDVWIGSHVLMIGGIKIGDGAIVAAGSVVTKDVPPYAIVGGVPAKIIRYRFLPEEIDLLLKVAWWNKDSEWLQENCDKFSDVKNFINLIETDLLLRHE